MRQNIHDGVHFRKVRSLHCTECNSAIYGLHHIKYLEQVPKICCLEKNILTKKYMVYQSFNNKVAILPKRELTLDLAEKPLWWKLFFSKNYPCRLRVYPCNFIKNGLQLRGFLPLVLLESSFENFGKFCMGLLCNSFTIKVAGLQSIDKFTKNKVFDKDIFQQTFLGLRDVFKTCLGDVLKTSSI